MATNVPMPNVDPIEIQIHETFDRLVSYLNERRNELVTRYREIQARPTDRARMERELLDLKADTEQRIQVNLLRETQSKILAELEQKLEVLPALSHQIIHRCMGASRGGESESGLSREARDRIQTPRPYWHPYSGV